MPLLRPRVSRGARSGPLIAFALLFLTSCRGAVEPYPQPYPANIDISVSPSPGETVDATAVDSVTLRFSRSMDPASLRFIRKMSFLLPLTVERFEGRWNATHTSVTFDLNQLPIQRGTLYEAVFTGLRTAAGDLYNLGPYRVWFRTRGQPDLFPMGLDSRLTTREFCHRTHPDSTDCAYTSTWRTERTGAESLAVRTTCDACNGTERDVRQLYRRVGARVEWLGFDVYDPQGDIVRSVRWPQPVALFAQPVRRGDVQQSTLQVAGDGTRLQGWTSQVGKVGSPVHLVAAPGLPIQIVYSESRILDIEYDLVHPDAVIEHRLERWWLYPAVGVVQREIRSERSDRPAPSYEIQTFAPEISTN